MHLGVEATRMVGDWRGIGRYTRQLLRHFARLRPELRLTLYTDSRDQFATLVGELAPLGYGPERSGVAMVRALKSDPPQLIWYPWNRTKHFSRAAHMVVTVHDLAPFHFRYRSWLRQGLQRKIERRFRESAERADLIITDSAHSADPTRR